MPYRMFINGKWVDAQNGGTWDVINPATGALVQQVPYGDAADARAAVDAAAAAQPAWAALTPYQRAGYLLKVAALLRERGDELARITVQECGKPIAEARGEWRLSADLFEWFAEEGKRLYGRVIPSRFANKRFMTQLVPMGVVAAISAWNFPILLVTRKVAASIAAGNAVVARPSEFTPLTAMLLAEIIEEAGMPAGVVNVVNGDPAQMAEVFLTSPKVRKLSFTGSQRVGRLLLQGAAQGLKKVSLELGGSAPVLILPDADPVEAAKVSVAAKFRNNGQVCISPSRFYVHRDIAEEYIDAVQEAIGNLQVGDGLDEATRVGPMITLQARDRVERVVAEAVAGGARLVTGGKRLGGEHGHSNGNDNSNGTGSSGFDYSNGSFYAPTLLLDLNDEMEIVRNEIFGPVMMVQSFDDLDEALRRANDTPYGLAAFVFGRDISMITKAYEGLHFGVIGVNDMVPATAEAPFGGVKESGIGRENSVEGIMEYVDVKSISIAI